MDTFNKLIDVPKYARMVPFAEIEKNDFNLNLPRYIDSQTPEDLQDIAGHLQGGIPVADIDALERYWSVCPPLRHSLFKERRPGYVDLAVDKAAIKSTIYGHHEFAGFIAGMNEHFGAWRKQTAVRLKGLKVGRHPKEVIGELSESLLAHYQGKPLIDPYDVYQHLMDYWAETMQDDVYLVTAEGWKAETTRVVEKDKKGKEKDKGWTCDLIPKSFIIARYFASEQATIDQLAADVESVTARLGELDDEHSGEDGVFADFDKVNKASVAARLKEIQDNAETKDEAAILADWLKLNVEEADLKRRLKEAEAALDAKASAKYPTLTECEVKSLVVDDKWLAALDSAVHSEMDRVSRQLTQPVIHLGDIAVDVVLKNIKNVHLSVHPPTGRVRISAPARMRLDTIRVFAVSKLGWIRQQQTKLRERERETPREYIERESHYVWGKRHLLSVIEADGPASIEPKHGRLLLRVPPRTGEARRKALIEAWYREELKQAASPLLARWARLLGVRVARLFVQRMKTRWGSCNAKTSSIRLNTELAKKPRVCLEYLVVHELIHLIEPTHNARFLALMDGAIPQWRIVREQLNRLPVRHDEWRY